MKNVVFLLCTLLSANLVFAQPPAGQGMPGGPGGPGGGNGHIAGKLVDSTGHGIAKASVLVLKILTDTTTGKTKETLIKGLTTQSNGDFSAEDLPIGKPIKISASAVGYDAVTKVVVLTSEAFDKDLGKLTLLIKAKELEQAVVVGSKPTMTVDMEKKVFNVSKDLVSVGGTGLDVLKNVPSVNVDIDGNVTVRGGSPQIFVDGQPTTLTLDEIPSDAIESIEVIDNPSAKYDASGGGAGILNIVLKKNRKTGYNGSVRAGADRYGGATGGADFNYRQDKINFSADLNYRRMRDRVNSSIDRLETDTDPNTDLTQMEKDSSRGHMYFGRVGLDYFVTNRTTLSLTGFAMHHDATQTSNIGMLTDSLYASGTIPQYSTEEIISRNTFSGHGAHLGIKTLFAKDKENWTADASYFGGSSVNNSGYVTDYFTGIEGTPLSSTELQQIQGSGNDKNVFIQTDYSDPVGKSGTLEAGMRAALQSRLVINNNYTYEDTSASYVLIPNAASNYKSQNNVYAAYVTYASTINSFTYKIGLRAESSNYNGTLLNDGVKYHNQYPVELFPSLFLGEKLGNNQELQLTYNRRVNRPNFQQLVPYTDSSNKLNITRGNPNLVPEFTQSLELGYVKNWTGANMLMASVYYKHTDHLITGYIEDDTTGGTTTLINTYINAESANTQGAELTGQFTFTKWWDISINYNLYHSKINVGNVDETVAPALWSYFGKWNMNFRLPENFSIQLSGIYQSKSNLPVNSNQNQPGPPNMQSQSASQGYIKAYYESDIAVKKTFMQNKFVVTASFNDMFRSRRQDQYTYSAYVTQEYDRLRDPQMVRLNLSWNFGKVDVSLFKRKSNNEEGETE